MEILRGKHASFINAWTLAERVAGYDSIHIDIGTGDGRYVRHIAQTCPKCFTIGIDSCRENLHEVSRRDATNALFVIANAEALPPELRGLAAQLTINFPWGSLLIGLLADHTAVLAGLMAVSQPNATLEVRLNGGALAEAGYSLAEGAERVQDVLTAHGFDMRPPTGLTASALKSFPTSWAKRLAYGRDPRALYLRGVRRAGM